MTHERTTAAPDPELAAELRWECETCGAQFHMIGPAALHDGVHQCSKCVEVEVLVAQIAKRDRVIAALTAELEAARAVVAVARAMHEIGDAPFMDELDAYDAARRAREE